MVVTIRAKSFRVLHWIIVISRYRWRQFLVVWGEAWRYHHRLRSRKAQELHPAQLVPNYLDAINVPTPLHAISMPSSLHAISMPEKYPMVLKVAELGDPQRSTPKGEIGDTAVQGIIPSCPDRGEGMSGSNGLEGGVRCVDCDRPITGSLTLTTSSQFPRAEPTRCLTCKSSAPIVTDIRPSRRGGQRELKDFPELYWMPKWTPSECGWPPPRGKPMKGPLAVMLAKAIQEEARIMNHSIPIYSRRTWKWLNDVHKKKMGFPNWLVQTLKRERIVWEDHRREFKGRKTMTLSGMGLKLFP